MNKNLTISIQSNDELSSYVKSDFVVRDFGSLCENSLETYNSLNYIKDIEIKDFKTNSPMQIDFSKDNQINLTYEKNPQWHIVDAGVSRKSLTESYDSFYTTTNVANEAGGNLSHFLSVDNMCLQSFTPCDFKRHGNFVSITGPFGDVETVSFQKENDNTTYLACGHVIAGTLTNTTTGENITICGNILYSKSVNDFGLAVNGIAFHTSSNIFTEDKCLGYAFAKFSSFCPSSNTFWKNKKQNPQRGHGGVGEKD